jgi:hypothetical protein
MEVQATAHKIYFTTLMSPLFWKCINIVAMLQVGPCHHGMARPRVADGGTASNMEGSCEYIEQAAADSQ